MDNSKENINSLEKEIDLLDLGRKLWDKRKFILKISSMGFLLGIIIAFSIPKEYMSTVILAPESQSQSTGNMGALAAMAGINIGGGNTNTDISSDIYPNIIESTPFMLGLSEIQVFDPKIDVDTTLYSYIKDEQKVPWWTYIQGIPNLIRGVFSSKNADSQTEKRKNILTKGDMKVVESLKGRVNVAIDKKTGVITLTSMMQSPQISALIADTLTSYLQSYIISYRTEKARNDLSFAEKLYAESKIEYDKVQRKYADYLDKNQNVILASYKINQEKLQNEVNLAYTVYNQMAQQLQLAKVKVQDQTPVYTIIQPAIVPFIPAKPNKKLIVLGFTLLFAIGACGYVLVKEFFTNLKS